MKGTLLRLLFVSCLGTTIATFNFDEDASDRWIWKTEFKKPQSLDPIQRPGTIKVDLANLDLFSPLKYSHLPETNPNLILSQDNTENDRSSSLTLKNKGSIHIPRIVFMKVGSDTKGENKHEAIFDQAMTGITSSGNQQLSTTVTGFVPKRPLSQNLGTKHRGVILINQILNEKRRTAGISGDNKAEADLKLIHANSEAAEKPLETSKGTEIVSLTDVLLGKVKSESIEKHLSSYLATIADYALKRKALPDIQNLDTHKSTLASTQELPVHEPGKDNPTTGFFPSLHLLHNFQGDEDEFIPMFPTHNEFFEPSSFHFSSTERSTPSSSKTRQDPPNIPAQTLSKTTPVLHSLLKASPKASVLKLPVHDKTAAKNSFKRTTLNITPNNINQILNEGQDRPIDINIGEEENNIFKTETDNSNQNLIDYSNLANDIAIKWQTTRDIQKAPSTSFQTVYGTSNTALHSSLQDENLMQNRQTQSEAKKIGSFLGGKVIRGKLELSNPKPRQWRLLSLSERLQNVQTKNINGEIRSEEDLSFSVANPSLSSTRDFSLDSPLNTSPYYPKKSLRVFDAVLTDAFYIAASSDNETQRRKPATPFITSADDETQRRRPVNPFITSADDETQRRRPVTPFITSLDDETPQRRPATPLRTSKAFENGPEPNELAEAFARLEREDQNRILEILAKGRSRYSNRRWNYE